MPAKKVSARRTAIKRTHKRTSQSNELSPDAKLLIVLLLLFFLYPVGLLFMWIWVDEWPRWLKIVITVPLFLGIIMFIVGMFFIATIMRNAVQQDDKNSMYQNHAYQQTPQNNNNPTATPYYNQSPTPVVLPSTDTTY